MRASIIVSVFLVSACSSQAVKCDRHLTRINPQQKLSRDPPIAAGGESKRVAPHEPVAKSEKVSAAGAGGSP
ncbi:MAG TPA: hypothetical protein VJ738_19515 [Steroidobacteraceae bacterium]|nr:hypothetical protein [Steroidobacteraceae bacterium]